MSSLAISKFEKAVDASLENMHISGDKATLQQLRDLSKKMRTQGETEENQRELDEISKKVEPFSPAEFALNLYKQIRADLQTQSSCNPNSLFSLGKAEPENTSESFTPKM